MISTRKIFTFVFPAFLAVILISIGVISWLFSDFFRSYYMDMTKERLLTNALAMRMSVAEALESRNDEKLNLLVRRLSENIQARITVIAPSGKVLADSNESPSLMENHATSNRKEVLSAIRGETGYSVRYSSTMRQDTMYVAVPVKISGRLRAVLRTSFPLDILHQFLNSTYKHIIGIALAVATAAVCLSFFISRKISLPLERLKETAAKFAKGDFTASLPSSGIMEIQELAESMNTMSESLQNNIDKITQQKNELKLILSSMFEGVIAVDTDDKIITMNRAANKILNTSLPISSSDSGANRFEMSLFNTVKYDGSEKFEQTDFRKTIKNPELHKLADDVLETGANIVREIELSGMRTKIISVQGAVLRDISGSIVGVLLVVSDITQIAQLENMRRNFAANVSHELKTPLTAIKGAVETLIDGALRNPEDADRFLKIIYKHSERLNALINDIMSLSKIEQDNARGEVKLTPCRLKNILDTAVDICREKADSSDVRILVECTEQLMVFGNEQMLEQVFVNLIDNAVKFSPSGGSVTVTANRERDFVAVSVTDYGCGIPSEHVPRLFERFYRVDKGRSRSQGGTGLGLAIVKHIVNAHHGTVEVISEPGVKTVFTAKLPFVITGG